MGNKQTRPSGLTDLDQVIEKVADAITDDNHVRRFGLELGLKDSTVSKAIAINWEHGPRSSAGNRWMLSKWANADKLHPQSSRHSPRNLPHLLARLRAALTTANLKNVAEIYLPNDDEPPVQGASPVDGESGDPGMTAEEVQILKDRLAQRYKTKFVRTNAAAADQITNTMIQQIFVSLIMVLKSGEAREEDKKIDIDGVYDLIQYKYGKTFSFLTRFAFVGEEGAGKTTLLKRIAFQWALGHCLKDIDLLFVESFNEMEDAKYFGNIVLKHFPDITEIKGNQIDKFIKSKKKRVAIFILSFDETKMNLSIPNPESVVISLLRGDTFMDTPVLITTRPFVADLIKSKVDIRDIYGLIEVKGFTPEGARSYVKQFFKRDKPSADDLIQFIESNSMISQLTAAIPIVCSMMCIIWKEESREDVVKRLRTTSKFFEDTLFSFREFYAGRQADNKRDHIDYKAAMEKAEDAVRGIGEIAFHRLKESQITFSAELTETVEGLGDITTIACDMGILIKEKKLVSRALRRKHGVNYKDAFCFTNKLLQEYIASFHILSLYEHDRSQFNKILTEELLGDLQKYKRVLFFTAHDRKAGRSVVEALCQRVDDFSFIMEVAFECHDEHALAPVKELLVQRKAIVQNSSDDHVFAAHVFACETYGKDVIENVKHTDNTVDPAKLLSDGPGDYAKALCSMPRLEGLEMADNGWQTELFFRTLAENAQHSQIVTLKHIGGQVISNAAAQYAKAIDSMPRLQNLELNDVTLSEEFFSEFQDGALKSGIITLKHEGGRMSSKSSADYGRAIVSLSQLQELELVKVELGEGFYKQLAEGASESKIITLKHEGGRMGSKSSADYGRAIVSLSQLQKLELVKVELGEGFYKQLADGASKSKIMKIKHEDLKLLDTSASRLYAKALFTMPKLHTLELCNVHLSDEFYKTTQYTNMKILNLKLVGGVLSPTASAHYAKGICLMPHLQSLEMDNVEVRDESFYKAIASGAASSQIESLRQANSTLGPSASSYCGRGLFFMPNLRYLDLERVKLQEGFFSCMAETASNSGIIEWRHVEGKLSATSSYDYAKGLFSMQKLRSLKLITLKLDSSFFKAMATEAAKSEIEDLKHTDAYLDNEASHHYAVGLCSMPNLHLLELRNVKLCAEFYTSMEEEANRSKIRTLAMEWCEVNAHMLDAIFSLPRLETLKLVGKLDLSIRRKRRNTVLTSVNELSLDGRNVGGLWSLGVHTSCPKVKKLALFMYEEECDITEACCPFRLTELHIDWQKTLEPESFCDAMVKTCPHLNKLTLSRINLGNEKARAIIQNLKAHPTLIIVKMESCWTNQGLKQFLTEQNHDKTSKNMTVTVNHGPI